MGERVSGLLGEGENGQSRQGVQGRDDFRREIGELILQMEFAYLSLLLWVSPPRRAVTWPHVAHSFPPAIPQRQELQLRAMVQVVETQRC